MNPTNSLTVLFYTKELLNSNQRLHPMEKAERTKHIRNKSLYLARSQVLNPMTKAHCIVHVSFPDKRRRDVANYYPTIKAAIDGIIDANLLPDDDNNHLIGPDMRVGEVGSAGQVGFHFAFYEVADES